MRIVVIGLIFAAVILAGGTAYLLNNYLSSQEAAFASRVPKAPTQSVLVAKTDLPIGTVINDENTQWVPWPKDAVRKIYIKKTKSSNPLKDMLKDPHLTRRALSKGDPITKEKLYKSSDPGFLRGALSPGMRAVAVKSNAETSSGGFILPGDHVDMLLTHKLVRKAQSQSQGGETEEPQSIIALDVTTETILKNLRVLAIDQKVNEFKTGAALGKTVLLEVTQKQAEIISTAKDMGKLSLVLRSAEAGDPRTERHFTTDIEVSPLLSSFDKLTTGENGGYRGYGGDTRPIEDDEGGDGVTAPDLSDLPIAPPSLSPPKLSAPSAAAKTPAQPPAATPEPKRKITVYRGTVPHASGNAGGGADEEVPE